MTGWFAGAPWWLIFPVVIVAVLGAHLLKALKSHGPLAVLGRWLTGVPLGPGRTWTEGRYYWTNAGWFTRRRDVRVLHRSGHAPKWQHLNLATRTIIRTGGTLAVPGLLIARTITVTALCLSAAGLLGARQVRPATRTTLAAAVRRVTPRGIQHTRSRVTPFSHALASVTGTSPGAIRSAITWNPDYANAESGAVVASWSPLPDGFKATPAERRLIEDLWAARTGMDLVPTWRTSARTPSLQLTRARTFPPIVTLDTLLNDGASGKVPVLDLLEGLGDDQTGMGADDAGNLHCWDWASESPHAIVNAGSRHGKSELLRSLVCQVLRKGGDTTLVDVKRVSFQGLDGVPGLTIRSDPRNIPAMWQAIEDWYADMEARIDARAADPTTEFSRSLLIIEEVNMASDMWDDWWEQQPQEDPATAGTIFWKAKRSRKTPPVWRRIKAGLWEGAFVKKNIVMVGQNLDGPTLKGCRNAVGLRVLGGYQPQNWKALVGTTPVPAAPPQRGRFCLVSGARQTWLQTLIADTDPDNSAAIWRDYARAGRRLNSTVVPATRRDLAIGPGTGPVVSQLPRKVTLRQAVDSGLFPSLAAARKASTRPGFPEPAGMRDLANLYDLSDLRALRERRLTR